MPHAEHRGHVHHVPVVGKPPEDVTHRAMVILDTRTGRMIGRSPHVEIRQTMHRVREDGTLTTTLKITPVKGDD